MAARWWCGSSVGVQVVMYSDVLLRESLSSKRPNVKILWYFLVNARLLNGGAQWRRREDDWED